ncbi:MAG: DNA/RNA nuclease SfsA [Armatimonadota bacterium]|nr:DNA/RNA nuclease SfsA [Armatimonadota bacterium]MDR7518930.1 DNA/RNA nuclease SfsA [Armatimonadota bacterium]MDR7550626.1 DNA/RNA nuclease SfsA [Armatimonadota bacterium]
MNYVGVRRGTIGVLLPQPLHPAVFERRANRFAARLRLKDSRRIYAHLPNSGRMTDLLVPGARCLIHVVPASGRRTHGTMCLVRHGGRWVGLDARLPNVVFEAMLQAGGSPPFTRVRSWRREIRVDGARIDFALATADGTWLVETKSCNRVEGGVALFPDGPTARGTRHLEALTRAARRGIRTAVVWFVQRADARRLQPDADSDPAFTAAAAAAARAGVRFYAYLCRPTPKRVTVHRLIPVDLPAFLSSGTLRPRAEGP